MDQSGSEIFDVVVVGGGPAGSTTASFVAMRGHKVLLLEKETFPRYQIGESLLPSTIHGVCKLLGVTDELKQAGFTVKHGGTFRWGANPEPWNFNFAVSPSLAGPASFAYQAERMKFDDILLKNASRVGVDVREGCSVIEVLGEDRVTGVRYLDANGGEHEVSAEFVVDASGNKSRIHKRVGGERRNSEFFRNIAIFGYFEGGKRLPAPSSGNILSAAFDEGWIWYIPLTPTLTSVGVVVDSKSAHRVQGDPEAALSDLISRCPIVADYLRDARRVTEGVYGQIRTRKDYSYSKDRFWSPGMVLVGDSACFVDPVFSSGVHLATYSGLLAARSINSTLTGKIDEEVAFREFERRYRKEYAVFYEFLVAFYGLHVDKESYFWEAKKVTQCDQTEFAAFVELVGGISSGEPALLEAGAVAEQFNASTDALAQAAGTKQGHSASDFVPWHRVPIVEKVRAESTQILIQAQLGDGADTTAPLFTDGLSSSPDGLSWEFPA